MVAMRQMLLSFMLVLPLATSAWGQTAPSPRDLPGAPDADPHQGLQDQVPDLQLLPPRGPNAGRSNPRNPAPQAAGPQRPVPKPPETDDQLLARLAKAPDQRSARPIERELKARWSHSGSPERGSAAEAHRSGHGGA